MNTHNDIYDRLRRCWSADTSSDPDHWEQANPAWGQCAVTACLVQDILGGDILWTMAICPDGREYSHYFNMLPKGVVFDATRQQFPRGTIFAPDGGIPRTQSGSGKDFGNTREYVLSYQATLDRYVRLQQRFKSMSE